MAGAPYEDAIVAVSGAVSGVADTVKAYGPNDAGKVVSAAKKAGNAAKKNRKGQFPKWLKGGKDVAKQLGIEPCKKGTYENYVGQQCEEAYQMAFDRVFEIYEEAMAAQTAGVAAMSSEDYLQLQLQQQEQMYNVKNSGGCAMILAFAVGVSSVISCVVYYLVNFC